MKECKIKTLNSYDFKETRKLDELSGSCLSQWLEDENENLEYVWGIFIDKKLIGYCSVNNADDMGWDNHEHHTINSLCLSDVYVLEKYRHNGYATKLVKEVLKKHSEMENNNIYLTLTNSHLVKLYSKCGFKCIDNEDYYMMYNR